MDRANRIVREILEALRERVKPGMTTAEIDAFAEESIRRAGGEPAFKGYPHRRDGRDFPATVCASVNDEVVHGIPSEKTVLQEGDILSVDCGVLYKGYFGDAAETYPVGRISPEAERLLRVTRESLLLGIEQVRSGNRVSDIGHCANCGGTLTIIAGLEEHAVIARILTHPGLPALARGDDAALRSSSRSEAFHHSPRD